jgi:hypothetical protein
MKTSFAATVALALFAIPAVASAASLQYDPADKDNGQSHFVAVEGTVNSANAIAAKADAARYAEGTSGAVIGTHGDAGSKVVTEWDANATGGDPLFVQKVIVVNPANEAAAQADAARFPAPIARHSDSADEAAKVRG